MDKSFATRFNINKNLVHRKNKFDYLSISYAAMHQTYQEIAVNLCSCKTQVHSTKTLPSSNIKIIGFIQWQIR